jgi:hypothetical protein
MAKVICIHLSGETEVIGVVEEEGEDYVAISSVRRIVQTMEGNNLMVHFVPFNTGDLDVPIDIDYGYILAMYVPDTDFLANYYKQTVGADVATTIGV